MACWIYRWRRELNMDITIGPVTLIEVRRYRFRKHMDVGIKEISNIPESGQLIDEETYSFNRPVYEIGAVISNNVRRQLERLYEDKSAESYNDGINTDTVQLDYYKYDHEIGYDEHMVRMTLLGSSV